MPICRARATTWPELLIGCGNCNNMKNLSILTIVLLSVFMTSCEVIGDIFSAGFYIGGFVVVLVIGIIMFFVLRGRK